MFYCVICSSQVQWWLGCTALQERTWLLWRLWCSGWARPPLPSSSPSPVSWPLFEGTLWFSAGLIQLVKEVCPDTRAGLVSSGCGLVAWGKRFWLVEQATTDAKKSVVGTSYKCCRYRLQASEQAMLEVSLDQKLNFQLHWRLTWNR